MPQKVVNGDAEKSGKERVKSGDNIYEEMEKENKGEKRKEG